MGLLLRAQAESGRPSLQQMLMAAGMDSGQALTMAAAMMHQSDPTFGYRLAQHVQGAFPQKRPSHHLGKGL